MRDNSNDSTVQTIQSMESSLQDLTPVMIKMGNSIEKLGHKIEKTGIILHDLFADISLQFKALARQHANIVGIMKEHLPQSSNQTVSPVKSSFIPKQSDTHKSLVHLRAAFNPLLLQTNTNIDIKGNENKESFNSTATFQPVIDRSKDVERLQVSAVIDKMVEFRAMWQNQSVPTEEKLKNKKNYSQQVNQAYLMMKDTSKENKQEILKIRMELISLNYKDLIASLKSNSRLINKE